MASHKEARMVGKATFFMVKFKGFVIAFQEY